MLPQKKSIKNYCFYAIRQNLFSRNSDNASTILWWRQYCVFSNLVLDNGLQVDGGVILMQPKEPIQQAITAALTVMDRHLSALNERNTEAIANTLHFPHFRLVGSELKVWETADRYFDDFTARAGENWAYTKLTSIKPISATTNKVHLDVQVNRFDTQQQLIADFKSIWVITEINGVWAAQLRSSLAPA